MTIHHVKSQNYPVFSASNAANGDTFDISGTGGGVVLSGLSNTTMRFLGSDQGATLINDGPTKIYDDGHGTHLILASGIGLVTIYDFQHDKTGYIREMQSASKVGQLTPSSDGHGGTYLTGVGLTVHLVGDAHVAASQHS